MSCGNHHDTPCHEVLDHLYPYLDGELDDATAVLIAQHLTECGPCLTEHEREALVSALVRRSCGCDLAPEQLRVKILTRITATWGSGCPSASSSSGSSSPAASGSTGEAVG